MKRRGHGSWWCWFLSWLLLCTAWSLATPLFSGEDEGAHVVRAAALARGDVVGRDVSTPFGSLPQVRAPGTILTMFNEAACFRSHPEVTPRCVPRLVHDNRLHAATIGFARYPPFYYSLLAAPLRLRSSASAVYAARLIAIVASAALLASAFASAQTLGSWAVLGVAVAITPMVPYFAAVVNPSGLEIASAITVWASSVALARAPRIDERLVARTAVAYVVCVNTRGLSLLFATIALAAGAALMSASGVREIVHVRRFALWCALAVAGVISAVAWWLYRGRFPRTAGVRAPIGFFEGLGRSPRLVEESIGSFASFEVRVPATVVIWSAVCVLLVVIALARATRRDALVVLTLIVVVAVTPVIVSMLDIPPIYSVWLGRVGLPLTVGLPVVAGAVAATWSGPRWTSSRTVVAVVAVVLALAELLAFVVVSRRWVVGTRGPVAYFLHPVWEGLVPPSVVLLLAITALGAVSWRIVAATRYEPSQSGA